MSSTAYTPSPSTPGSFVRRFFHLGSRFARREVQRRLSDAQSVARMERGARRLVRAAQDAMQTPKRKLPQTKSMPAKRGTATINSTINALAGRAAIKKKGKTVKVKARKTVKVSKGLREKVVKVMAGENAYGEYYVRNGGTIGYINPRDALVQRLTTAIGRDDEYTWAYWNGPGIIAGSKVWFGGLCVNTGPTLPTLGLDNQHGAFVYFSPLKILNAASILWNGKANSSNWATTTGNFSTVTSTSTGTAQVGSSAFPQSGSLEIRVINSYANWRIKNINQRTVKIKIYHCVSKLKYNDKAPLTCISDDGLFDQTGIRNEVTSGVIPGSGTIPSNVACHPLFEPKKLSQFNNAWKYDVTEIVLKPGEECTHTIQGPKNYTLDYSKLWTNDTSQIGSFFKDTTKCCMVSVELDSVYVTESFANDSGQWAFRDNGTVPQLINPISIETDEVYKLSAPKNTGFLKNADATGSVQQLNLKANRYVYSNFNTVYNTAQSYTSYNEENPAAPIGESIVN